MIPPVFNKIDRQNSAAYILAEDIK